MAGRDALEAPADASDRIGIYYWGADDAQLADRLGRARRRVTELGSRTMRVTLSPHDFYGLGLDERATLVEVARHPGYAALFADPELSTILLTTYSAAGLESVWADGFDAEERAKEEAEIEALGVHLLETYPDKTFILLNWEGDNALFYANGGARALAGYRGWTEARIAGVAAARETVKGKLYSGLEFNRVFDCDERDCVLTDVAPYVDADFYSYSSYEALAVPQDDLGRSITDALDDAYASLSPAHPGLTRAQMLIGEFGFPREAPGYGDCRSAERMETTIDTVLRWGVSHAIFWQLTDNVRRVGEPFFGFGAYRPDGTMAAAGEVLLDVLEDGEIDGFMAEHCPNVMKGGVVDATDYTATVDPDGYVSIFGSNLVGDGGGEVVVHFTHEDQHFVRRPGSAAFYASDGQVNAKLPDGFTPGTPVLVYVTNTEGWDSPGQFIVVAS